MDGLWIDMNEVSNFCNGACSSEDRRPEITPDQSLSHSGTRTRLRKRGTETPKTDVGFNPTNPPYAINNRDSKAALNTKTLDMDAQHMDGSVLEYDAHNIYGLSEAIATNKALENLTKKRGFVISRSTFPGSGTHTGHWTGEEVVYICSCGGTPV